jgi:adenosylmethionine-8-amino-7-oxononanoate aminotransferase
MKDHEWLPLIPIRAGKGVWLEDSEGRRCLDAISSWWVNLFGHCNPRINAALVRQLETPEHVPAQGSEGWLSAAFRGSHRQLDI